MGIFIVVAQILIQVGILIAQGKMLKKYSESGDNKFMFWATMPFIAVVVIGMIGQTLLKMAV